MKSRQHRFTQECYERRIHRLISFLLRAAGCVLAQLALVCCWQQPAIGQTKTLSVTLPNGITVELAGVTRNTATARTGWRPDGSPMHDEVEWPRGAKVTPNSSSAAYDPRDDVPDTGARDYLIKFSGIKRPLAYAFTSQSVSSYSLLPFQDTMRFRASGTNEKKADAVTVSIVVTDEPWGKYQQVGLDGALLNQIEKSDPYWLYYRSIRILRPGEFVIASHLAPSPELVMRRPNDAQQQYAFEIRAIDSQGKPHNVMSWEERTGDNKVREILWRPDSEGKDVVRFEYRLRPYRFLVAFDNVSTLPGHATAAKVSVKALEDAQPEAKSVANKRLIQWLRALSDGHPSEKAQACFEIQQWAADSRPEAIDPRLIKSLIKWLGSGAAAVGPNLPHGRVIKPLDLWARDALELIGRPAVADLIVAVREGDAGLRGSAICCLGKIKSIGPAGVDALIASLDYPQYDISGLAAGSLEQLANEPTLVPKLIAAAEKKGSLTLQSRAIGILGTFPGDNVDAVLRNAFNQREKQIRLWALHALNRRQRPQLAADLVEHLDTDDSEIRSGLTQALSRIAQESIDALLVGMNSPEARVRMSCAQALTETIPHAAPRVVPVITKAFLDQDPQVRVQAMSAVVGKAQYFERGLALNAVLKNIQHPDLQIRARATSMAQSGVSAWGTDPRLVPHLLKNLEQRDHGLLCATIGALGAYREPLAVPKLIQMAESFKPPSPSGGSAIPFLTTQALGEIGDPRAIPVLRKLAKQSADGTLENAGAIEALSKLRDRESVPLFIEALASRSYEVRTGVARAFEMSPDSRATPALITALFKEIQEGDDFPSSGLDRNYTSALAGALVASGDPQAVAALVSRIPGADAQSRSRHDPQRMESEFESRGRSHVFTTALRSAPAETFPEIAKGLTSKSLLTRQICAYVLSQSFNSGETIPTDPPEFRQALLAALHDSNLDVRKFAIQAVARLRIAEAEPVLLARLHGRQAGEAPLKAEWNEPELDVRAQVEIIHSLAYFRSDRVRDALLKALHCPMKALEGPTASVRAAAAGSLLPYRDEATVSALLKALMDNYSEVAIKAARTVGHFENARAIGPLLQMLNGRTDVTVRTSAVQALGLLRATEAQPELREILKLVPADKSQSRGFDFQLAAAISLVQLHDDAGTARLHELLQSSDQRTRQVTAEALLNVQYDSKYRNAAKLTHEPTRAMLRQYLAVGSHYQDWARTAVLEVLGGQLDAATREILERFARDASSDLHRTAIFILANSDAAPYEEQLLKLLENRDDRQRRDVVPMFARIPGQRVTDRLLALTVDASDELRQVAVKSLEKRPESAVTERLKELTADPSLRVRTLAAQVLQKREGVKPK